MGNGMRWELRMWSPSLAEIHLPRGILCCQVWPCVSPCTLWGYCWHTCKDTTVTRHWEHTHHLCFLIESSKFFYKVYVYAIVFFWLKWNSKPNIGQCVKKQELLHTACKNLHCYKHFGKYIYQQLGLKMWISYDPPIPYLGIYSNLREIFAHVFQDTWTRYVLGSIVVIEKKKCKQPKCLSAKEWVIKMLWIHRMEC